MADNSFGNIPSPVESTNVEDTDYDEQAKELLNLCMVSVASVSATTSNWLQLTCAAIALHTSQIHSSPSARAGNRLAIIQHITQSETQCRDLLRLSPHAFAVLVCELKRKTGVKNYSRASIDEQLITFLLVLGHNFKNRVVRHFLCRSGETISRYFNNILVSVITLEASYVQNPPTGEEVQPAILDSHRFYPFFKDCLGAVDGTHVRVKVSPIDAPRYRGRKDWPTQNVLAACTFDLKFTYILAGWEGSAADSRVLQSALTRAEPLVIPDGKFYLGDAGFGLTTKVLTPYARTRYHLKEYSKRAPETAEELFNHRHSSLRNSIERAFGVLKKRFPIIASGSECHYSCAKMTNIILACCVIHNFILTVDSEDSCFSTDEPSIPSDGLAYQEAESQFVTTSNSDVEYMRGKQLRDLIARKIHEGRCLLIGKRSIKVQKISPMSTPKRGKTVEVTSTDRSPKNFRWSQDYEDTLLEPLVREARNGNRPDSTFTASAFINVVRDFNYRHGTCILKKHVQSRIKTMKQHFVLFHGAFSSLSGFSWNDETKKFEAENELWEQRIMENPTLEKFRYKSCYNWDKLLELYGGSRATGCSASGLKERSSTLQRALDFEELQLDSQDTNADANEANDCSSFGEHEISKGDHAPATTPEYMSSQQSDKAGTSRLKRKSTLISVMEDGYKTMAASIDKLSMAVDKVAGTKFDVSQNCQIYDALDALALDDKYRLRCYCYLCAHPSKAAVIVAAPTAIRVQLLEDVTKTA